MKPILTRGNSITDNEIDVNDIERYKSWLPTCTSISSAKEIDREFIESEINYWYSKLTSHNVQLHRETTDNKRFNLK